MAIPDKPIRTNSGLTLEFHKLTPEQAKLQAEAQKQAQHHGGYVLTHSFRAKPGTTMTDVITTLGHFLYNIHRTIHLSGDVNASGSPENPTVSGTQLSWHAGKENGGNGTVSGKAKGGK